MPAACRSSRTPPEGNAGRLAYHDARKLNDLRAWLDYQDVIHGRETPAERRARKRSAAGRPASANHHVETFRALARSGGWGEAPRFRGFAGSGVQVSCAAGKRCRLSTRKRQRRDPLYGVRGSALRRLVDPLYGGSRAHTSPFARNQANGKIA